VINYGRLFAAFTFYKYLFFKDLSMKKYFQKCFNLYAIFYSNSPDRACPVSAIPHPAAIPHRFHDHILRNDHEYHPTHNYIMNNPRNWQKDKFSKSENKTEI